MELRGQDMGMPNSLSYNPAKPNHELSSKLSSIVSAVTHGRINETGRESTVFNPTQTLDHHHQLNLEPQQQTQRPGRDPNPDPDPVLPASATVPAGASNSPPPPPNGTAASIRYRECLKNHAASMGAHVLDGCGEFMPSGEEGTLESLKCAACDCHRNFHRREVEGEPQSAANCYYTYNPNGNRSQRGTIHPAHKYSHGYSHCQPTSPPGGRIHPVMMAFRGNSGGALAESSSEDLNMFHSNAAAAAQPTATVAFSLSKKRFRTKFTQAQKDRMQEFAEKLGWKMQKQDEQEMQLFCTEVGVKRQAFKVWMHNNKQAMKKKQL
uniref:Putative zinc-finger homeodomain protein 6 n=1 Tax=Davidia involucrata TaxID=16924 RepID=A0A5B6YXR6_DAVIN